jgi:hypothetical protein
MSVVIEEARSCPEINQSPEWIPELPIESTFPLGPEIKFRSTNREKHWEDPDKLTPEQVEYYQRENLICFLCEFAGKVPYKKIPGILTEDGRFKICNMDVLDLAKNSAQAQGAGSREEAEYVGGLKR